jgi:L-ascorbate metabolism protein UlaG (beta-lactamase superfamily)
MTFDGMNICHLGDLGHKLSQGQIGNIGNVDILFIPVGGHYTIGASEAVEVITSLEPRIVIPMHYKATGLDAKLSEVLAPVEDFIKEIGLEPVRDNKLTITPDKLPEEMQVWVLERKS